MPLVTCNIPYKEGVSKEAKKAKGEAQPKRGQGREHERRYREVRGEREKRARKGRGKPESRENVCVCVCVRACVCVLHRVCEMKRVVRSPSPMRLGSFLPAFALCGSACLLVDLDSSSLAFGSYLTAGGWRAGGLL